MLSVRSRSGANRSGCPRSSPRPRIARGSRDDGGDDDRGAGGLFRDQAGRRRVGARRVPAPRFPTSSRGSTASMARSGRRRRRGSGRSMSRPRTGWRARRSCRGTFPEALFIDVGSTTTDIIPDRRRPGGRTRADRSGAPAERRAGLHRRAAHAGVRHRTVGASARPAAAASPPSTSPSLPTSTCGWGESTEPDYTCETPDGRGRSRPDAGARLARMVCADLEMLGERDITATSPITWRARRCDTSPPAFAR